MVADAGGGHVEAASFSQQNMTSPVEAAPTTTRIIPQRRQTPSSRLLRRGDAGLEHAGRWQRGHAPPRHAKNKPSQKIIPPPPTSVNAPQQNFAPETTDSGWPCVVEKVLRRGNTHLGSGSSSSLRSSGLGGSSLLLHRHTPRLSQTHKFPTANLPCIASPQQPRIRLKAILLLLTGGSGGSLF